MGDSRIRGERVSRRPSILTTCFTSIACIYTYDVMICIAGSQRSERSMSF
jgi:hypothetical protein